MRRLAATVAAIALVSLVLAGPVPAASAKSPPPPKALASVTIDAHLGYMKQTTCSPKAKPGTTALLKTLMKAWGGSSSGISRQCSVGATSEHKEGRALDWHMDMKSASQRARVKRATDWLTANNGEVAYRLGVMYVIWNQHIWSLYYPELGWRKMASRGSYTANHKNHVHISLSWDGAMKQTSWWTGAPIAQPLNSRCGVNGARACLPTIGRTSRSWPYQKTVVAGTFLPAPWTAPNLGGSPQVGRTLTAVPGTWVPAGAALTYQWLADSKDIAGATGATHVVSSGTIGKEISVRITATSGTTVITRTTDGTPDVLKARFGSAPRPRIEGVIATDQTVTAASGSWSVVPETLSYSWKRNGKAIKGATAATYVITAGDTGDKLSVKVTARKTGYYTASSTSAAARVAKAKFSTAAVPVLTGDPVVGAILTADAGAWAPTPRMLTYQWFAGTRPIRKATGASFTLTAAQSGKEVAVRVRATRSGYSTTDSYSTKVAVASAG